MDFKTYKEFRTYYYEQMELQRIFAKKYPGSEAIHTGDIHIDEVRFKDHLLLMIKEVTEILDEINYKPHVRNKKPVNKDRIVEELVDTFKFLLNLMLIMGIEPDEFEKKYAEKHRIVMERIEKNI